MLLLLFSNSDDVSLHKISTKKKLMSKFQATIDERANALTNKYDRTCDRAPGKVGDPVKKTYFV